MGCCAPPKKNKVKENPRAERVNNMEEIPPEEEEPPKMSKEE